MPRPTSILVAPPVVLLALLCAAPTGQAGTPAPEKIYLDLFRPTQVVRGQSTTITVVGKNLSAIDSVEITPPEGISVKNIREIQLSDSARKEGRRGWEIVLLADKAAQTGERSLVLVTPQGRWEPQTIRIPTHVPRISNLRVLSAQAAGARVKFSFALFDGGDDLGEGSQVRVALPCGRRSYMEYHQAPEKMRQTGPHSWSVQASYHDPGATASGVCVLEVGFEDAEGNESNVLTARVRFRP